MSRRTVSVAVAVSAIVGGLPNLLTIAAQSSVVGAKVVSPLAHAMRLVDRQQLQLAAPRGVEKSPAAKRSGTTYINL